MKLAVGNEDLIHVYLAIEAELDDPVFTDGLDEGESLFVDSPEYSEVVFHRGVPTGVDEHYDIVILFTEFVNEEYEQKFFARLAHWMEHNAPRVDYEVTKDGEIEV